MKDSGIKQLNFLKKNRQTSTFILNLCAKPISIIRQFQLFTTNSKQNVYLITPEELDCIIFNKKECSLTDLMCEAEIKIKHFKYSEAETIYSLIKNAIYPKYISLYRTYYAKSLTGLGYLTFYQQRHDESEIYFKNALNEWKLVNNHQQVAYCLQMLGVVYRFRSNEGDILKSLEVLDQGIFFAKSSNRITKTQRMAMIGNCLRDKSEILLMAGCPEEAYKIALKSLEELCNSSEAIYSYTNFIKCRSLFDLSKHDIALDQIFSIIEKIDGHPIFKLRCHTFLAEAFIKVLKNKSEAINHFRQAVEASSESSNIAETMKLFQIAKKYNLCDFEEIKHKNKSCQVDFKKSYDYFKLL